MPDPHADAEPRGDEPLPAAVARVRRRERSRSRYKPTVSSHLAVDAAGASWTQVDDWPVSIDGNGSLCWDGGTIAGTWGRSTPWATFHHTGAFSFANPNSVVENVRVSNYGDAINVRDGASNWTVRGAHTSMIHDDCLQDDFLYSGRHRELAVRRVLRGHLHAGVVEQLELDGHDEHADHARLAPAPAADADRLQGSGPGTRRLLQVGRHRARSPKLALFGNVFRVDQPPNHGSLGLPDGYPVTCCGQHHRVARSRRLPRSRLVARQVPRHQDRDQRVHLGRRGRGLDAGALGTTDVARHVGCAPVWVRPHRSAAARRRLRAARRRPMNSFVMFTGT